MLPRMHRFSGATFSSNQRSIKIQQRSSKFVSKLSGGRGSSPSMQSFMAEAKGSGAEKRVVIIGGGIIGASVAFYLSERGLKATVVEREEVACAASGNAGGFLALDWNDSSPVGKLARLSYKLHADLASRFGADKIGYRKVTTLQVSGTSEPPNGSGGQKKPPRGQSLLPDWVDGNVASVGLLGTPETTAQVHPRLLTRALVESALDRGSTLVKGTVKGLRLDTEGVSVTGVELEAGGVLPAEVVVLAMGPWTESAVSWLNGSVKLGITAQKYHSVVLRPSQLADGGGIHRTFSECLFTSFTDASGRHMEPEVYPRPDGSVYVCGEPQGTVPLPPSPSRVTVEPKLCDNIQAVASSLSSTLGAYKVEAQQACYLPLPPDGLPIIGQVPGFSDVFVASGHSCWGILNGPATGLLVSELILDGQVSSLQGSEILSPARLTDF